MACCARKVSPDGDDDESSSSDGFHDIASERGCTDILWIPIFALFWIGMFIIAGVSMSKGDPAKLLYAQDYEQNTCGSTGLESTKYVVYPRINEDIYAAMQGGAGTPTEIASSVRFYGVCVEECPDEGKWICDKEGKELMGGEVKETELDACVEKTNAKGGAFLYRDFGLTFSPTCKKKLEHCWKMDIKMTPMFYRCLPIYNVTEEVDEDCMEPNNVTASSDKCTKKAVTTTTRSEEPARRNPIYDQLNSVIAIVTRHFGDLQNAMLPILVTGLLIAVLISAIWLVLLRLAAPCIVWSSVIGILLSCIATTVFCYSKAGMIGQSDLEKAMAATGTPSEYGAYMEADEDMKNVWKYVAYGASILDVIILVMIVASRQKIAIAIGIIKEASRAMTAMKSLLFYPFSQVLFIAMLAVYWIFIGAYLMSADDITYGELQSHVMEATGNDAAAAINGTNTTAMQNATDIKGLPIAEESSVLKIMMAYHFFGLLWTNQLIQGIGIMTVSGAVGKWYFNATSSSGDDDDDDEDGEVAVDSGDSLTAPVVKSCCRTVRYHLGSIMFGAFIIAVVQFLRAALAYLDSKTKDMQDKNKLLKVLMKVVQCILWCFEKCVKYVSKMAYIQTAVKGTSFCISAMASVKLIMSELALIGIINTISTFIMSLSKVLIAVTAGFVGFAWLEYGNVDVSSSILPVLVIIIFAYFTATGVLGVYDTSIDTILLCFLLDKKHNDSEDCHAGPGLKKFISKNKSKKKNKKEKGEGDSEDEGEDDDEYDSVNPSGDGSVAI